MDHIRLGLSFDDVLLIPQRSRIQSRKEIDLTTRLTPKVSLSLPYLSSNMTDVTNEKMAIALGRMGGLGVLPRFISPEKEASMVSEVKKENLTAAASIGCKKEELSRAHELIKAKVDILFLDVAHGHLEIALNFLKNLKNLFKDNVEIVAGNITTYEGAFDLFKLGADAIKVGVGPGSICTTRIVTGSGVPQISAIMDAAKAARKFRKYIVADGGTKNSGDVVKALAAGASAVMIGNQFAGCDESPGEIVEKDGKTFKRYNASTSLSEKKNHIKLNGNLSKNYIKQIEGVESLVPFKGPLAKIVESMSANVRSGLSYSGAKNIPELWKRAKFIQVTSLGLKENGAHDVIL